MQPQVSIIISVYQRADYLKQAIEAALGQDFEQLEVIVTEDGASPAVKEVVDRFSDSRLRFLRNDPPLGAAANKLAAWQSAGGEFLVNLDDDDLIDPTFLRKLVPPLVSNPAATVAFCDHWLIDASSTKRIAETEANTIRWGRAKLQPGYIQPCIQACVVDKAVPLAMGAVFRKEIIRDFRIESGPCYDAYLSYLACRLGQAAWYTSERLSSWRVHDNQETGNGGLRIAKANIFLNGQMARDPNLVQYQNEFLQREITSKIDFGISLLREGRVAEGREHLQDALSGRVSKRALLAMVLSYSPKVLRERVLGRRWWSG